jgi:hypothetical protein
MSKSKATPLDEKANSAIMFAKNLVLMHASYSTAIQLCSIKGDKLTWKKLKVINENLLITLHSINVILDDKGISC